MKNITRKGHWIVVVHAKRLGGVFILLLKHIDRGAKIRGKNLRIRLPKLLQTLMLQIRHLYAICLKLLGTPPIIFLSFLISNLWMMKCSLSQISLKYMLTY